MHPLSPDGKRMFTTDPVPWRFEEWDTGTPKLPAGEPKLATAGAGFIVHEAKNWSSYDARPTDGFGLG